MRRQKFLEQIDVFVIDMMQIVNREKIFLFFFHVRDSYELSELEALTPSTIPRALVTVRINIMVVDSSCLILSTQDGAR